MVADGGKIAGAKVPPKGKKGAAKGIVDHKNHNRADYNKSNLRVTTSSVNRRNRTK